MQYEQTGDSEYPHRVIFEGEEIDVVRSAYREHVYELAKKGNTGSMEQFEANISSWEDNGETRSLLHFRLSNITDVLDEFVLRTEDAIQEIPEVSGVPAFLSDDIGERFRLGRLASELADEIRQIGSAALQDVVAEEAESFEINDDALDEWRRDTT